MIVNGHMLAIFVVKNAEDHVITRESLLMSFLLLERMYMVVCMHLNDFDKLIVSVKYVLCMLVSV